MSDVRYVGFLGEASGFGVAARAHLAALDGAGVDVAARAVLFDPRGHLRDAPFDAPLDRLVRRSHAHRAVLVHSTPLALPLLREAGRLNIGVTVWETEALPAHWDAPVRTMDELWVPSEFSARAFRQATARPVHVVPHPVVAPPPGPRRFPGVPDDLFVFLAIFEWQDRKNPEGVVRAFRRAFGGRRDVALLLKVGSRLGADHGETLRLIERLTPTGIPFRTPPVFAVLQDALPPAAVAQLYRRADAYVSLHRAEGFGLCMAEAMAAGLPVIATGWSGNLEFMDGTTAFLVDHRLVAARQRQFRGDDPFRGMRWAEPDRDAAVDALRACVDQPSLRTRIAAAGQARVAAELAPSRIGALMRARLEALGALGALGARRPRPPRPLPPRGDR